MPEHQTNPKSTFTEKVMNRFYEVNALYDITLNEVHHLFYATNISSNKSFTFLNAMKQDDNLASIDAMEKKITNHENSIHWSIVHCDTLPNKARPIKSIWSSKRKQKPDEELLNHKALICAHGDNRKIQIRCQLVSERVRLQILVTMALQP